MDNADKKDFLAVITKTWRFYGKQVDPQTVADWWGMLVEVPLPSVAAAFNAHLRDPDAGEYLPKPANIFRHLDQAHPNAHPSPDEAWGLLIAFVSDEGATGFLTEQMREAWRVCAPVLNMGDKIGARMAFLEAYRKALKIAAAQRIPPVWAVTLGHDVRRRQPALQEAVARGYISADCAASLLPAPVANLEQVAGLLEGKGGEEEVYATYAQRLRALVASIKSMPTTESPAAKAERERREYVEAQKAKLPPKPESEMAKGEELEAKGEELEAKGEELEAKGEELPTKRQRRGVA